MLGSLERSLSLNAFPSAMSPSSEPKSSTRFKMFSLLHQALTSKAVSLQYYCEGLVIPKANYRGHVRNSSSPTNMPTNVQDLPAKEINVLNKNTGFPEPLSTGMPRFHKWDAETDFHRPQHYPLSPRRRHFPKCLNRSTRCRPHANPLPQLLPPPQTSQQAEFRQDGHEEQRPLR